MCYRHAYKKVKVRELILGQFFYDLYSRRNKKGASSCKVTVNRLLINYSWARFSDREQLEWAGNAVVISWLE